MADQHGGSGLVHRRIDLRGAHYLGGHPGRPRAEKTRFLYLAAKGVEFRTGMTPVTVPWESVTALKVGGAEDLSGWDLPGGAEPTGGDPAAFLLVESDAGRPLFEIPGMEVPALLALLEPLQPLLAPGVAEAETAIGRPEPDVDGEGEPVADLAPAAGSDDVEGGVVPDGGAEATETALTGAAPGDDGGSASPPDAGEGGAADAEGEVEPDGAAGAEPATEPDAATEPEAGAGDGAVAEADAAPGAATEPDAGARSEDAAAAEPDTDAEAAPAPEADADSEAGAELAGVSEGAEESAAETDTLAAEPGAAPAGEAQEQSEAPQAAEAKGAAPPEASAEPGPAVTAQVEGAGDEAGAEPAAPSASPAAVAARNDASLELDTVQMAALGLDGVAVDGWSSDDDLVLDDDFVLDELILDEEPVAHGPALVICGNGHECEPGTRFCPQCGEAVGVLRCPRGHPAAPGAVFCSECGAELETVPIVAGALAEEVAQLERAVGEAAEALERIRAAQESEIAQLFKELGDLRELASDERFLPLRRVFHEQHVTLKRAEMALAEARLAMADSLTSGEAGALVDLRRTELDFAIQMLLESTELIALPGNDEEGKELVHRHMAGIFTECDDQRLATELAYAKARDEPHAVAAAELDRELTMLRRELAARRGDGKASARELWEMEGEIAALWVRQLEARRAAAIAQGDVAGTDAVEVVLGVARREREAHAASEPPDARAHPVLDEMKAKMSTVFTGADRVPRTTDRRVGVAKRAVAEFRDYFDAHPAATTGLPRKLAARLEHDWEEYSVSARKLVGAPTVITGRSDAQTRVQWIKADQMIINAWTRRVTLVATELEVSRHVGDEARAEALQCLLDVVTEGLRVSSQAAKVEVPAV